MATAAPAWRTRGEQRRCRLPLGRQLASLAALASALANGLRLLLAAALALSLASAGPPAAPAWADAPMAQLSYRCDGEPLQADLYPGAVDAPGIANSSAGTLPGAFVVLHWRDLSLQLPRTNNAGAPSFTDGRWWWSLDEAEHPSFRLRQGHGDVREFRCEALLQAGG